MKNIYKYVWYLWLNRIKKIQNPKIYQLGVIEYFVHAKYPFIQILNLALRFSIVQKKVFIVVTILQNFLEKKNRKQKKQKNRKIVKKFWLYEISYTSQVILNLTL